MTQRLFGAAWMWLAIAALLPARSLAEPSHAASRFVYVGTYTAPAVPPGGSEPSVAEGIYVFRMDAHSGALTPVQVSAASNPSYLALDASLTHLYSVNEDGDGLLSAYAIDPQQGTLSLIDSVSSAGSAPTYLSVHPSGQYLMAANYSTGNYPIVQLEADGSFGATSDVFQSVGNGAGANPDRQEAPHAHQIITDPTAEHVFAVDLGSDKINVLTLDLASGLLAPNAVPFIPISSGSGPRHMAFHGSLPRAYVLDELASTITVFTYDATRGSAIWLQTISTLPADFAGTSTTAEIRIHPGGRFLYNTNRGHDSVASFEIDQTTGKLTALGWQATGGQWPRGMNIDPSGSFLYVANQNTNDITTFRIHRSGRLQRTASTPTPTPVDITFGPLTSD